MGYTRKDNAVRAFLALDFEKGVEYLSSEDAGFQLGTQGESLTESGDEIILINEDNLKRGAKSKDIYLSIDTFKAWCMSAHTANRAGLAGNKAIKEVEFLAKQLERLRGSFEEQESKLTRLTEALKDSEVLLTEKDSEIDALQKALKLAQSNSDMAGAKLEGHEMLRHAHKVETAQLKARIRELELELRLQVPAIGSSSDSGDLPGLPPAR